MNDATSPCLTRPAPALRVKLHAPAPDRATLARNVTAPHPAAAPERRAAFWAALHALLAGAAR